QDGGTQPQTQWPEPGQGGYAHGGYGPGGYTPQGTSHWNFQDVAADADAAAAGSAAPAAPTGQWAIPVAQGDLPDESGEFSTSVLTSQWAGGGPSATLPGGALAPWAETGDDTNETADGDADTAEAPAAAGSVPEAAPAREPDPLTDPVPLLTSGDSAEHPAGSYVLRVNGADRPVTDAWIGESLLYVLRERLGLAGAKDGCSQGECGACNVQVDGRLVASCLVPAATAAGSEVRTVEGLATEGEPSDVQRALATCGAVQCGFCIPGMAMTVHDLLEGNHAPSELETRQALCGNLCRCSGYRGVLDAVDQVVAERRATAEAAAAASEEARVPHQTQPGTNGDRPRPGSTPHSPDGGMA
ncbi:(2Fe-2S)-binding protein, partial [Streptomyces sp. NPDC087850]|uniref:(2Fe-2S)-binding protein n=1 Tax=Streptomyces sp. NPDC087850 TaxID=3365809 RepID=UPI0037F13B71